MALPMMTMMMIPDRIKLTDEGGKPQTVTQVSRGLGLGAAATSWALLWL